MQGFSLFFLANLNVPALPESVLWCCVTWVTQHQSDYNCLHIKQTLNPTCDTIFRWPLMACNHLSTFFFWHNRPSAYPLLTKVTCLLCTHMASLYCLYVHFVLFIEDVASQTEMGWFQPWGHILPMYAPSHVLQYYREASHHRKVGIKAREPSESSTVIKLIISVYYNTKIAPCGLGEHIK